MILALENSPNVTFSKKSIKMEFQNDNNSKTHHSFSFTFKKTTPQNNFSLELKISSVEIGVGKSDRSI